MPKGDDERIRIEGLNNHADYTVLGNDTTTKADSTVSILGDAGTISFAKVDGAANTTVAGIFRTDVAEVVDIGRPSPYSFLEWEIYLSAKTNIASAFIRLGSDSSNYCEYRYDDSFITAGQHEIAAVSLSEGLVTGTGMNPQDVKYIAAGFNFDAETDALADCRVGNLFLEAPVAVRDI